MYYFIFWLGSTLARSFTIDSKNSFCVKFILSKVFFYFKIALTQCGNPPKIDYATLYKVYNEEAEYKCNDGYMQQGPKKISCQPDGEWRAPTLHCRGRFLNVL